MAARPPPPGNLWGPVATVAFGYVLEVACAGAIVALALTTVYLLERSLLLLFLDVLLVLLASLFLVYLTVVCAVAVVVSVAEPEVATCALGAAVSPVYTLALRLWPRSPCAGAAAGAAYVALLGAVEVFSVAAVTAYYFECRDSKEEEEVAAAHRHRYAKLPNGDA
ncbi:hypothetical protein TRIUR3_33262 [Triticum urartu]|uniref:Uncharacterized protein n=1 Tax=Triticum urartu TaxID=4572 RepID=M7ZBQ2_TRIUA|nr:hypothetical protein TRIUR3_33262 [Triticum urartu]